MLLLAVGTHWRWPFDRNHRALVLWGGWLLTAGIFFSVAGFFHEYYLSMMAAPLAALVGIGVVELWRLRKKRFWLAAGLVSIAAGCTLAFQYWTAQSFTQDLWWLYSALVMLGVGLVLLIAASISRRRDRTAMLGFALVVTAMLVTPGVWSALTNINTSSNQSLPAAYSGGSSGPANRGGTQINSSLLSYLEQNTQGVKYLMAVPSSMQGADYILATGRPVLYLGGFDGQYEVVTADDLSKMVSAGELRYIYWSGGGGGPNNVQSDVSSWVASSCQVIQGFDTITRNAGAPDGTSVATGAQTNPQNVVLRSGGGDMQIALYDCGQ